MPNPLEHRSDIRVILAQSPMIYMNGPRGGIWWCEDCWGGGFLDHPPIGRHRPSCTFLKYGLG